MPGMRNSRYAQEKEFFKKCCELAGVKNTTRQASKFRNRYGAAFSKKGEVIRLGLIEEKVINGGEI